MKQVHCGVFPARAEGWNLEALEMLACGKHLIITNCTGHTEFANNNNSMLIDMNEKELAYDEPFFYGQGNWYSFGKNQKDQLIEYMRSFHNKNMSGELTLNNNGIQDSSNFTWEKSSKQLISTIDKVMR
jgi:glycosyltransferase involved in cell wall biosynthesis